MNKKLWLFFSIGCLFSAATLYLAFRNVPLTDLLAYLKVINYWWLIPTTALILATFALRTLRWQIILKDAGTVGYWQAFHPLMIGFMMNCILPGRVGELARPAILKKTRGIALTTGLATVVAERIFDMVLLMILLFLLFGAITSRPDLEVSCFGLHLNHNTLVMAVGGMIRLSIFLLLFIIVISFPKSRALVKYLVGNTARLLAFGRPGILRYTEYLAGVAVRIIDNFSTGLALVQKPHRLLICSGITVLIWAMTVLSYIVFAQGCPGIQLSFIEWTTVMVVICFFIALPSVPGFWGLWEAAGVFALALFGVTEKDALGFTLVNHATQMFPVIAAGLISALFASVNIWQLSHNDQLSKKSESSPARNPSGVDLQP